MIKLPSEFRRGRICRIGPEYGFVTDDETGEGVLFFLKFTTRIQPIIHGLKIRKKPTDPRLLPKENDRLAYLREDSAKGFRTRFWCFEKSLDEVIKEFELKKAL